MGGSQSGRDRERQREIGKRQRDPDGETDRQTDRGAELMRDRRNIDQDIDGETQKGGMGREERTVGRETKRDSNPEIGGKRPG